MKYKLATITKKIAGSKFATAAVKAFAIAFTTGVMLLQNGTSVFANGGNGGNGGDGVDFKDVTDPIVGLLESILQPLILIVGAGGTIFAVILGVKYATAEEPQEKEKRKQALKTAIIGFVLIFVLVVALRLSIEPLTDWMNRSSGTTVTTK